MTKGDKAAADTEESGDDLADDTWTPPDGGIVLESQGTESMAVSGGTNIADVARIGTASAEGGRAPEGTAMGEEVPADTSTDKATAPEGRVERSRHDICNFFEVAGTTQRVTHNNNCGGSNCKGEGRCPEHVQESVVPADILAAAPPAVANPYLRKSLARAQDAVGELPVEEGLDERGDSAGMSGDNPSIPHHAPFVLNEKMMRRKDLLLQQLSEADHCLISVYGDKIRHNDGTHMSGDITPEEDKQWQGYYNRIVSRRLQL